LGHNAYKKGTDLFKLVIKLASSRPAWVAMFDLVIRLLGKQPPSIVPELHDMVWIVWKSDAPDSWHAENRL